MKLDRKGTRMQKFIITIVVILFSIINTNVSAVEKGTSPNPVCLIKTSMGEIAVELFIKDAPKTVENFISLAEGKKKFTDPKTNLKVKKPYYDNLIFHRVIKNFMIQGGCPKGDGSGDPGYKFEDEINASYLGLDKMPVLDPEKGPHPYLGVQSKEQFFGVVIRPITLKLGIKNEKEFKNRLDEIQKIITSISLKESYEYRGYVYNDNIKSHHLDRGVLAMANAGPNTNGSQFFINLVDTKWLEGKHTVFGKVIKGMDVVDKIGNVPVLPEKHKPKKNVKIISIRLVNK